MTLLELVQRFCRRQGLPYPSSAAASTDKTHLLCVELLNAELDDLTLVYKWEGTLREATWVSTASADQGALATLAPSGFRSIANQTVWDRTDQTAYCGPLSAAEWQMIQATTNAAAYRRYRVRGGHLLLDAAADAGHTLAFEYRSSYAVEDNSSVAKRYFTADDDTPTIPDTVLLRGLEWRWLRSQGLPFEDYKADAITLGRLEMAQDGSKPILRMDSDDKDRHPSIGVPESNWTL
jgi:hypothetical protein